MKRIARAVLALSVVAFATPALACGDHEPPPKRTSASACPFLRAHGVTVAAPTCPFLQRRAAPVSPPSYRLPGPRILTASAPLPAAPALALR